MEHRDQSSAPAAQLRPAQGYAGDVSPQLACQWWQQGDAVLVDVRTDAEREWVGMVPGAVALAWKQWPGMAINAAFELMPGDIIYSGTPENVGPVVRGDVIDCHIDGLPNLGIRIV